MHWSVILLPSVIVFGILGNENGCCNGFEKLCKLRYNEVVYPTTHNGHSYQPSQVHNQDIPLKEQFDLGIRATKLHVWYDTDDSHAVVPFVCHGIDKKLILEPPLDKVLAQVPFFLRSFVRTLLEKISALKPLVQDALHYAYGTDNASGRAPFKHCILDPSAQPLKQALKTVADFLQTHPHDVMTLILEDHTRNSSALYNDVVDAGLLPYLHVQNIDQPWPLLKDMIDQNKRLVVFVQADSAHDYKEYPWMHSLWDYAFDTQWDFKDVAQFKDHAYDDIPHRGKASFEQRLSGPRNKIFLVHHFITDFVGGNKQQAIKANKKTVLKNRLSRLIKKSGQVPTFIQVDFFEHPQGDYMNVINELNGIK